MRRAALVLAVVIVTSLTLVTAAFAVGPGGWDHVGVGATATSPSLNGHVYAMNTQNPGVLYVGGDFTSAGGNASAQRLAKWSGSSWSAVGAPALSNGAVRAIAYSGGKVYAGGTFVNAGGNPDADYLAVWDGTTWAPFCTTTTSGPSFGGSVAALQVIGNTLYVGGSFQNGAGIAAADYLLACNLTTGASSSTVNADGDFEGAVYALTADSNGVLYAAGQFVNVDQIAEADHVAAYDGTWHAMGTGPGGHAVPDYARGITAVGTDVYVGTDSVNVAGIATADHVARWNGSSWSALGTNTAGTDGWFPATTFINALTSYGSLIVAAGSFQNANGLATADEIAVFDGTTWRPIGSDGAGNGPLPAELTAVTVFGGKLFASGNFTKAGGDAQAQFLAAYSLRQPDALIGGASAGPFVGNAVYSSTGAGEARTLSIQRRHSQTCYVRIQNDGLVAASFVLKGTGGASGITVKYYRGATNVTTSVKAGTYATTSIPAGGYFTIRAVVSVAASSAATTTYVVKASSTSGTTPDAVRAVVKAHN